MIEFRSVRKEFPDGTVAVEDFSFVLPSHQTTVLVGSSGCGKTTLLRMINRMVEPTSGQVLIDDVDVASQDKVQLRRNIGYVLQTIDAARANGMTEWQILTQVEIPLALPLIVGGIRASVLQVVATVTIASYAGRGGLGRIITSGIGLNDYDLILGGAILVTALALALDGLFALLQRAIATKGLADDSSTGRRPRLSRSTNTSTLTHA